MGSKVSSLSFASSGVAPTDRLASRRPVEPAPPIGDRDPPPPSIVAALAKAGPPVDAEKVQRLRDAIAAGSYRADPKAIAKAMIAAF